jgi:N-acetylglucosaminyldiphosphoundecaprenol N-acetyl-beta-D-mannosaminyltransferase
MSQRGRAQGWMCGALSAWAVAQFAVRRRLPQAALTSADSLESQRPVSRRPADQRSIDILGVRVSAIGMADALMAIERWISERSRNYVCVTGAHGVMESRRNERLRGIHNRASLVAPDGMPLVWLAHLIGETHAERVYGPDLMRAMTEISELRGYRQFYYGGAAGVAEKLGVKLIRQHPNLQVAGVMTPPFRDLTEQEDEEQVRQINAARPDILWIGLGTPKQETWMAAHLGRIEAPVMIGVGAAFDFLAGTKQQAPRWMQRNGLEWLFRLVTEPRRLWRRYAYIVPGFAILIVGDLALRALRRRGIQTAPS